MGLIYLALCNAPLFALETTLFDIHVALSVFWHAYHFSVCFFVFNLPISLKLMWHSCKQHIFVIFVYQLYESPIFNWCIWNIYFGGIVGVLWHKSAFSFVSSGSYFLFLFFFCLSMEYLKIFKCRNAKCFWLYIFAWFFYVICVVLLCDLQYTFRLIIISGINTFNEVWKLHFHLDHFACPTFKFYCPGHQVSGIVLFQLSNVIYKTDEERIAYCRHPFFCSFCSSYPFLMFRDLFHYHFFSVPELSLANH